MFDSVLMEDYMYVPVLILSCELAVVPVLRDRDIIYLNFYTMTVI